jgi:hypothetical protein
MYTLKGDETFKLLCETVLLQLKRKKKKGRRLRRNTVVTERKHETA